MLKKLFFTFTILFLSFGIFVVTSSIVSAQDQTTTPTSDANSQILEEFCQRRQGGIINLETWYAGQCDPEGESSTFSGANLGFGDIIILHVYELLAGEGGQGKDVIDQIFQEVQNLPSVSGSSNSINYLALLQNLDLSSLNKNDPGLVMIAGKLVATTLSRPPVQTYEYIASVRSNMARHQLVQPAYAQGNAAAQGGGYGFANFTGFLPMWRAFRNIAYFFFILAFVVYGFAIMFRVKLGQTAINIQLALPKLITTLLIITFSYAIVGFLIDAMWVIYYLILNALGTFGVFGDINPSTNVLARIFSGQFGLLLSAGLQGILGFFVGLPSAISAILGVPFGATALVGLVGGGVAIYLTGGSAIIIFLIFLIAIFIAFAKLFIKLITAYVTIIGNLILAPLILLPDALPGKGGAFANWINNLIANIVVFPATSILLLFSGFFMMQPVLSLAQNLGGFRNIQSPPNVPLLFPVGSSTDASAWMALIGLAILLMTPKFVDMIQKAFKVQPLESSLGEALAGGAVGYTAGTQLLDKKYGDAFNTFSQGLGSKVQLPKSP